MKVTKKYLQKCIDRVNSADPTHTEVVIKDLRRRMNRLIKYIKYLESGQNGNSKIKI